MHDQLTIYISQLAKNNNCRELIPRFRGFVYLLASQGTVCHPVAAGAGYDD